VSSIRFKVDINWMSIANQDIMGCSGTAVRQSASPEAPPASSNGPVIGAVVGGSLVLWFALRPLNASTCLGGAAVLGGVGLFVCWRKRRAAAAASQGRAYGQLNA
jgi:hypothetical protein